MVLSDQWVLSFNPSSPEQNDHYFADNIVKHIFMNEKIIIFIKVSLRCLPKDPINNTPTLV